jgi:hypothetical protein
MFVCVRIHVFWVRNLCELHTTLSLSLFVFVPFYLSVSPLTIPLFCLANYKLGRRTSHFVLALGVVALRNAKLQKTSLHAEYSMLASAV